MSPLHPWAPPSTAGVHWRWRSGFMPLWEQGSIQTSTALPLCAPLQPGRDTHRHSFAPMLWAPEALSAHKWKGGEAKALCLLSPFEGGCLLGRVFFPLPKKGCVLRKQKWTRGPKGLFGPHYKKHTWSRRRNRDAWRCDSGLVPALGQFCTAGLCALLPQCKLCRENQCSEGWSSSPMRKGWRNWVCLAWRREGCRETSLWPSRS